MKLTPGTQRTLNIWIPRPGGSVLVVLDENGRPRPGWPITIEHSTSCAHPLLAHDGGIRIICDGTDLPVFDNDPSDVRAFAFDAEGRLMTGWPVQLRPGTAHLGSGAFVYFSEQWITDTVKVGTVSHVASVTTVEADGSIWNGKQVPMVETCCGEKWVIGPDGVAYGIVLHLDEAGANTMSELVAIGPRGLVDGFPVVIKGIASKPGFDDFGRIHVTVATPTRDSPYHGPARTLVYDTFGKPVEGGSGDLGFVSTDECVGLEGSCEGPGTPLVGGDGTTFVVGARFDGTTVARINPAGEMVAGWPYRSNDGTEDTGVCPRGAVCEGAILATPALGPRNILYLIHSAESASRGGRILAIDSHGRVVPGWPVELKRSGAEFWSVVVGYDGTVYALAVEPESGDGSSATILAIDPDSTVRYTTTIIEP